LKSDVNSQMLLIVSCVKSITWLSSDIEVDVIFQYLSICSMILPIVCLLFINSATIWSHPISQLFYIIHGIAWWFNGHIPGKQKQLFFLAWPNINFESTFMTVEEKLLLGQLSLTKKKKERKKTFSSEQLIWNSLLFRFSFIFNSLLHIIFNSAFLENCSMSAIFTWWADVIVFLQWLC
jgi:hypothetical protein